MTSLRKQLENIADALNRHVVPALNDDYAKGQGIAIVDIVLDIAKRADWSLDYLSKLWAAQVVATSSLTEAFEKAGAVLPCAFDATVQPWSTGQALKERIEATDQAFCDPSQPTSSIPSCATTCRKRLKSSFPTPTIPGLGRSPRTSAAKVGCG